jgi:hypothetical protein
LTIFPVSSQEVVTMEQQQEKKERFRIEPLEERIAPTIVAVNGGGNTPNGEANGVPRLNPAGNAPPGQN